MAEVQSSFSNHFEIEKFTYGAPKLPGLESESDSSPIDDSYLLQNKFSNKTLLYDNSDSGFSNNSDVDSSSSSESLQEDHIEPDFLLEFKTSKAHDSSESNNSFDFWNKTDHKKNNFVSNGDNNINATSFNQYISKDSSNDSKLDLNLGSTQLNQTQNIGQKNLVKYEGFVKNEDEISLSDLLADIDFEKKDKMVVPCISQPDTEIISNSKCSAIEDSNIGFDLSDLLSSVCISNTFSKNVYGTSVNNENDLSINVCLSKSSPSTNDTDDSLSDLLASINFDDNVNFNDNLFSDIKIKSDDECNSSLTSEPCESDEVSLASLAVKHLSKSQAFSYSDKKDELLGIDCTERNLSFGSQFEAAPINIFETDDIDKFSGIHLMTGNSIKPLPITKSSSLSSLSAFENNVEAENDDEDIDLTFCIKTVRIPDEPIKIKTMPIIDDSILTESIDLQDLRYSPTFCPPNSVDVITIPNSYKVNKKESLFSKALYCKPKQTAFDKVLRLKINICEQFFNLPKPVGPQKLQKDLVHSSNDNVVTSLGRRVFGQSGFAL